jgi:hypothetical protein
MLIKLDKNKTKIKQNKYIEFIHKTAIISVATHTFYQTTNMHYFNKNY